MRIQLPRGLGRSTGRSVQARGQALAETALVLPILTALLVGMMLAGFYAYRAAVADFGVFVTGVASGAFNSPATSQAKTDILWPDIRRALVAGQNGAGTRAVKSQISILDTRPFLFGIKLIEAQKGASFFRLWRFYAGPNQGSTP